MPPAHRKSAAPVVPSGKRSNPVVTKAALDAMKPAALDGDNLIDHPGVRTRLVDWHGAVAQASGTLVVAFAKHGLSSEAGKAIIQALRTVADDMEKRLFGN